jgi:MoaA/NifB/PqqE/SkfB family radical SAM enzyme
MCQLIEAIEFSPYKWVHHIEKLKTLSVGGDVFPVSVELDLVSFCNHACHWCVDPCHTKHQLSRAFVSQLLDELKQLGVSGIVLKGGGEPTLHPDFAEILREIKLKGFEVGIVTNGSNLLKYYEAIVDNADYLRVSIDGPTAESHHDIHQSNDYAEIIEGVRAAVTLRATEKCRHPIIGLSFAMDYCKRHLVNQAIDLANTLHVDYALLRPPFFDEVGRKNTMTVEEKQVLFEFFEKAKRQNQSALKVFIDYWVSDDEAEYFSNLPNSPRRAGLVNSKFNGIEHVLQKCYAHPLLAVVTADQRVFPCCNLRFLVGWDVGRIDYHSGISFAEIWRGVQREQIKNKINKLECLGCCTHPMSRYNEIIAYLKSPGYHKGFV